MAVGNALLDMYNEVQEELKNKKGGEPHQKVAARAPKPKAVKGVSHKIICPECGEPLQSEGGCTICKNCGWSKCM